MSTVYQIYLIYINSKSTNSKQSLLIIYKYKFKQRKNNLFYLNAKRQKGKERLN